MPEEKIKKGSKALSIYITPEKRAEIENDFWENRVTNFADGYRQLIELGHKEFKKSMAGNAKRKKESV
jgi:hypothetical protein